MELVVRGMQLEGRSYALAHPAGWEHDAIRNESLDLHEFLGVFLGSGDRVVDSAPGHGRAAIYFAGKHGLRVNVQPGDALAESVLRRNVAENDLATLVEVGAAAVGDPRLQDLQQAFDQPGRVGLVRLGHNADDAQVPALVARALERHRAVLVCVGVASSVRADIASRVLQHRYLVLPVLDEARHTLFIPVGTAEEAKRFSRFVRECPVFGTGEPVPEADSAGATLPVTAPGAAASAPEVVAVEAAPAPSAEDAVAELQRQLTRLDTRYRQQLEAQKKELSQLASELRGRLADAEKKHQALLEGRIFRTLGAVKRGVGWPIRTARDLSWSRTAPPRGQAAAPVAKPAGPAQPERLPPPDGVRLAGVSYMTRPCGGASAADVVYPGEPLVSVVMTTYNTSAYVEEAVRSILDQTWKNLELIVVDDCSSDDTRDRVERMRAADPRIQLYCFGENRGTYWCKNYGITRSKGDVVTFMDSDDTCRPRRLELQLAQLNRPGVAVSTCNHVRKDEAGNLILINGVAERVAYISQMVKRKVFDEIGYFDTIRTSADDEFLRRLRITYGPQAQTNVKDVLYTALLRDGSLTRDPHNAINFVQERNSQQSFLSPQRRHYAAMCDRWHKSLVEKNLRPYVPFPVVRRPFPVFGRLVVDGGRYDHNTISVCMASYPPREEKLREVVASLLPQVDHIYVYLNQYEDVPAFLRHSRITTVVGERDLRDNGKFHFMDRLPTGYCFTVDDDIAYPSDYIQSMIRAIEFYERKAVVGLHGTVYAKPIRSFFKGRTLLHFEDALDADTVVNQLGTGTVAFHTDLWRPQLDWFRTTGMADVWLAMEARRRRIPLVAVARSAHWLASIGLEETTLFREFRKNDEMQTRLVREFAPWKEELNRELAASVAAKKRAFGEAYARLLPQLGIGADARRA